MPHALNGYHEAIFMRDGFVQEGVAANPIVIIDGPDGPTVLTPPPEEAGVLPGITAKSILEIAKYLGCEAEYRMISAEMLEQASELAMAGTAMHGAVRIGHLEGDDGLIFENKIENIETDSTLYVIEMIYCDLLAGKGPEELKWMMQTV